MKIIYSILTTSTGMRYLFFIAETEKLAKENGIEKASLGSSIMINFNVRKQTLSFSATVKGERKDAYSTGDVQTGKVTNFRVK